MTAAIKLIIDSSYLSSEFLHPIAAPLLTNGLLPILSIKNHGIKEAMKNQV
jgi:hypothetical protein